MATTAAVPEEACRAEQVARSGASSAGALPMRLWLTVVLALLGVVTAHVVRPLQTLMRRGGEASRRPQDTSDGDLGVLIHTVHPNPRRYEALVAALTREDLVFEGQTLGNFLNRSEPRKRGARMARARRDSTTAPPDPPEMRDAWRGAPLRGGDSRRGSTPAPSPGTGRSESSPGSTPLSPSGRNHTFSGGRSLRCWGSPRY